MHISQPFLVFYRLHSIQVYQSKQLRYRCSQLYNKRYHQSYNIYSSFPYHHSTLNEYNILYHHTHSSILSHQIFYMNTITFAIIFTPFFRTIRFLIMNHITVFIVFKPFFLTRTIFSIYQLIIFVISRFKPSFTTIR